MMSLVDFPGNCGAVVLYNLMPPNKREIESVWAELMDNFSIYSETDEDSDRTIMPICQIVFSDLIGPENCGEQWKWYINEHKLGKVTVCPSACNPNTDNKTSIYVWHPDYSAIKKHIGG